MEAKITKIVVECKKSNNYQTYGVGFELAVNSDLDSTQVDEIVQKLQKKCREHTLKQIQIDKEGKK